MKTTSRLALTVASGLVLGALIGTPAKAADLGGNCCADLEERIAELEATTARKGNRKVSLTISGQINRTVMYWNDGYNSDVYSVDNLQSSSRFNIFGSAKINADWSAGYYITFDLNVGGRSDHVTQLDDDGADSYAGDGDGLWRVRYLNWWLQHAQLGKLTVGRQSSAGDGVYGLDLGEITGTATSSDRGAGDSLFVRWAGIPGEAGLTGLQMKSFVGAAVIMGRFEGVRWDSPTLQGFTLSASWGEDDQWDIALRFANEWNGLRVAAAVAYAETYDEEADTPPNTDTGRVDRSEWALAATAWHVPTGIFVNASWRKTSYNGTNAGDLVAGSLTLNRPDASMFWIAAGIKKNFFGIGYTSLYGEYQKSDDYAAGLAVAQLALGAKDSYVLSSEATVWGLGVVQQIDAAAMELYLSYRHFSFDATGCVGINTHDACVAAGPIKSNFEDLDLILAGARIKF